MVIKMSVKHNSPTALKRLQVYQSFIETQLNGILIQETLTEWKLRASDIIESVIYRVKEGTVYKRGRASGRPGIGESITTESISRGEAALFLDSTLIPDVTSAGFGKGYAAYFLVPGSGFLAKTAPDFQFRDFMGTNERNTFQWVGMTVQIFIERYQKMFRQAVKISNRVPEVFVTAGRGL